MGVGISPEWEYVILILGLFFVAKALQRLWIPGAITCLGIGVAFGLGLDLFRSDPVINVFAVLGITILFLFAGMELDVEDLRRGARSLIGHVALQTAGIALVTVVVRRFHGLELRPALLVALALLTPSTGFILDSLAELGVNHSERVWIKSRAIGTELVALVILLFALQSTSGATLSLSLAAITGMVVLLPKIFRLFATAVLPHAPNTEFAFLVVVALICATATKMLGVYYLVGAFVVGITEQRLRKKIPSLKTAPTLHAIELFASFFIPFYFLRAGLGLRPENFAPRALLLAGGFLVVLLPFRIALVAMYRRLSRREPLRRGLRLGVSLLPTLVFTLVIAEILRDRFSAHPDLIGGLVLYALVNTAIPSFILRTPPEEYETPEAPQGHSPAGFMTGPTTQTDGSGR
ncbi:MAG: cation:proton antiporter [Proteobacteria bacterium]|nr:cation:proton antiporter [Pseudomonadota bacterium]